MPERFATLEAALQGNTQDFDRALAKGRAGLVEFGQFADAAGRKAGEAMGEGFKVGADGRLRDAKGRFVTLGREMGGAMGQGANDALSRTPLHFEPRGAGRVGTIAQGFRDFSSIAFGARAAFDAIAGPIGSAITAASDFGETLNKTKEVFGPATSEVTTFADTMADRFGLVKTITLDAASAFGLMARAAGQGQPQAAAFGVQFAKAAADVSSFFNIPFEEALLKLRSGLAGEAEPLRSLGVFLNEAAVQSEAARLGIATLGAELTEGQKITARASLILSGLQPAMGDLERTSDSASNQIRKLWGDLENLQITLGGPLLDAVRQVAPVLADAARDFGAFVTGHQGEIAATAQAIGTGLVGAFRTLREEIGLARDAFTDFRTIGEGIGSLLPDTGLGDMIDGGTVKDIFRKAANPLGGGIAGIADLIRGDAPGGGDGASEAAGTAWGEAAGTAWTEEVAATPTPPALTVFNPSKAAAAAAEAAESEGFEATTAKGKQIAGKSRTGGELQAEDLEWDREIRVDDFLSEADAQAATDAATSGAFKADFQAADPFAEQFKMFDAQRRQLDEQAEQRRPAELLGAEQLAKQTLLGALGPQDKLLNESRTQTTQLITIARKLIEISEKPGGAALLV